MNCNCTNHNANRPCRRTIFSPFGALCFLGLVLLFTIGLILGAVFFASILPVLASVIAFAAAIAVIIIALLIYWRIRSDC